jgi:hypothetical protein
VSGLASIGSEEPVRVLVVTAETHAARFEPQINTDEHRVDAIAHPVPRALYGPATRLRFGESWRPWIAMGLSLCSSVFIRGSGSRPSCMALWRSRTKWVSGNLFRRVTSDAT